MFETADLNEVREYFGKNIQASVRKGLLHAGKPLGWKKINVLHLSAKRQGESLPEMLFWWVELYNRLVGDELGHARWLVPFEEEAFVEPLILPSGQVLPAQDVLPAFSEIANKLNYCLQFNSGQTQPLPGKITVRGRSLVLIRGGQTLECSTPPQLLQALGECFETDRLEAAMHQSLPDLFRRLLTEDDLALHAQVLRILAARLARDQAATEVQLVILHNFTPLGFVATVRQLWPQSVILWCNHLATGDPTTAAWNFFAPQIAQAQAALCHAPEFVPAARPGLEPLRLPVMIHPGCLYPFSPKNRELNQLGEAAVHRVLAQYQRDFILAYKFKLRGQLERAFLQLTGTRPTDVQGEQILDSLTKASIRAAFIEEGRRPEMERIVSKAAATQAGMLDLVRQLHGIDPGRPLFIQVSRYSPAKDPVGSTRAFALAHLRLQREAWPAAEMPQFAFAGSLEEEDPQALEELVKVFIFLDHLALEMKEELRELSPDRATEAVRALRRDIFILLLPLHDRVANALEVNALQRTARALVHKSLREGFGLSVTEAMWKGIPVIGSNTGGIRQQIDHGTDGFLAGEIVDGELRDTVEDTAQYILTFAKHVDVASRMGEMGHRKVAKEFLLPLTLNLFWKKLEGFLAGVNGNGRRSEAGPAARGRAGSDSEPGD